MNRWVLIDSELSLDRLNEFSNFRSMNTQQYQFYVERTDPDKNMARYYAMHISYSLFGEPYLTRQWGRIGTTGQVKLRHFEHEADAVRMFQTVAQNKQKRGYRSRNIRDHQLWTVDGIRG